MLGGLPLGAAILGGALTAGATAVRGTVRYVDRTAATVRYVDRTAATGTGLPTVSAGARDVGGPRLAPGSEG